MSSRKTHTIPQKCITDILECYLIDINDIDTTGHVTIQLHALPEVGSNLSEISFTLY